MKKLFLGLVAVGVFTFAVGLDVRAEALETARWQAEIDRTAAAGGGTVMMPAGRHLTGTLFLKNNVTLELAAGCVLEGSTNRTDYPDIHIEYAELREPWQGLVVAVGQTNVAVIGSGEVFGNGKGFPHGSRLGRPQGFLFYRCHGVSVENIRMRDLARWTCYLKECDGCVFRKVTVDSHANANNDGIDIDSKNVLVEDCDFDSDDDGIVFKSDNADFIVENVTVRNCRARSTCSAIKIGTGSHGGFRNILVENVVAGASPREWCGPDGRGVISAYRVETWPGSAWTPSLLSGIALECVDGAVLENVTVRNVTVERAATPIFVRGGLRYGRKFGNQVDLGLPFGRHCRLKGVLIENVKVKATSFTASSITGVPGLRLADITLRNVDIEVPGAGEAGRAEIGKAVPEKADCYPESNMFDHRMLPAYGFYIRHADGVVFENVNVKVLGKEVRPEIVQEDVTGFVRRAAPAASDELPPLITNCEIRSNPALSGKKAFYYCDDVIWLFRDLTRQRPASLFDNPFLKLMKEAHDRYGMKVQLNCFYRTDFFYGTDEFTLSQMTDAYKDEWQANKDWLKLGFHSLQEFPDYPFINSDYKDMKRVLDLIGGEIARFAGAGVFAKAAVVHWGTCSKEACRALKDAGFGLVLASCGPRKAYEGDPSVLPYGHAMRLAQNRKPETCLYSRISENEAISSSIGGYNNLTYDQAKATYGNFKYVYDREVGVGFKEIEDFQPLAAGINLYTMKNLIPTFKKYADNEFLVYGNHEQYFYRDYLAYQPEYADKVLAAAKFLKENGYTYVFFEDLVTGL